MLTEPRCRGLALRAFQPGQFGVSSCMLPAAGHITCGGLKVSFPRGLGNGSSIHLISFHGASSLRGSANAEVESGSYDNPLPPWAKQIMTGDVMPRFQ